MSTDYPVDKRTIVIIEETDSPVPIEILNVKYVAIPRHNLGYGFARNKAIEASEGEIIAFTDDDCIVEVNWLKEIVRPLVEDSAAGAAAGAVLVGPCGQVGKCENILGFPGGGIKYVHQAGTKITSWPTFSTCNCAIRRACIEKAGGFNENLVCGGEDEDLSRRIRKNHHILYNSAAQVYHRPRDSFARVFGWFLRRGRAKWMSVASSIDRGKSYLSLIQSSPILRLAVVLGIGAMPGVSLLAVLSAYLFLTYFLIVWRFRWSWRYYPSVRVLLSIPLVRLTMDFGHDIGVISAMASAKDKTLHV
jgi:GT2 family glycosyltransferase